MSRRHINSDHYCAGTTMRYVVSTVTNELGETFTFRLSKRDAELLRRISEGKGIDASDFVREAIRKRFGELALVKKRKKPSDSQTSTRHRAWTNRSIKTNTSLFLAGLQ